jgi:Cof subfamily protein (haloacid dehalogenase superfamily)
MVIMGKSKEILYEQTLNAEGARKILELGKKFKTTVIVWSNSKLYAYEMNKQVNDYVERNIEAILINGNEEEIIKQRIKKMLCIDDIDNINFYENKIKKEKEHNFNFFTSKPIYLEFVDNNISKAFAMEKIGNYFEIKQEEMIAIGDGFNDLEMIEYAGMGVAMSNAPKEIREKADYITLSNKEDGVAYTLDKFII